MLTFLASSNTSFVITVTEHARSLTASKTTLQKLQHISTGKCHSRLGDNFHFAPISINEQCQKCFSAFSHLVVSQ